MELTLKRCGRCETDKSTLLYNRNARERDGLQSWCRSCQRETAGTGNADSKRAYVQRNPERRREQFTRSRLKTRYGLTLEQYEEMLEAQDGRCAICEATEPGWGKVVFPVDHDHATGEVRGLLCMDCNTGLGQFKDNIDLLRAALRYLGDD